MAAVPSGVGVSEAADMRVVFVVTAVVAAAVTAAAVVVVVVVAVDVVCI